MRYLLAAAALPILLAAATPVPAGRYDVTFRVSDVGADGVPSFLLRMAKGRTRTERKCVPSGEGGPAVLIAPDAKAKCRVDRQTIANGRFEQQFTCPQKDGRTTTAVRNGAFTPTGYTASLVITGTTPKGKLRLTGEQTARYAGARC